MSGQRQSSPRGLVLHLRHALGRAIDEPPPPRAREPCAACGEETAAGSAFYSDRRLMVGPAGDRTFTCSDCSTTARAATAPWRPDEAEVDRLASNGSMAGGIFIGGSR